MTALATKVRAVDYKRLSLSALREMAVQTHPDHTDEAARVYVDIMIDMELERRLDRMHFRPGWQAISPTELIGMPVGGGSGADHMFIAYERGIPNSPWHDRARVMLGKLPLRRLIAVLIQSAKRDGRRVGAWAADHDQIARDFGTYSQMLGFPTVAPIAPEIQRDKNGNVERLKLDIIDAAGHVVGQKQTSMPVSKIRAFKDGQAIKDAAKNAKVELILLAKAGL
ncbi:MAG TPA: hypothetical protein VFM75_12840 [Modicisalibacter sp.]|nr:hypothetical protein [Modicisalibacter sp.]